jgi:DNA-binding GntR family transcriptional regulator
MSVAEPGNLRCRETFAIREVVDLETARLLVRRAKAVAFFRLTRMLVAISMLAGDDLFN